jgi:hypothetical protein
MCTPEYLYALILIDSLQAGADDWLVCTAGQPAAGDPAACTQVQLQAQICAGPCR